VCSGPWWTDGDTDKGHGGASLARGARALGVAGAHLSAVGEGEEDEPEAGSPEHERRRRGGTTAAA
jgi:hypothetical protein